jgi:CheY-like chemotaxis protein
MSITNKNSDKKILIAEDSTVIQNITKRVLQFQNYSIDVVRDGEAVLERLEKHQYVAILLDIAMPKMDGMECARKIRALQDAEKANVPLFALTGNAKNYTAEEFSAAGFDDVMHKPINFDELVVRLEKIIEAKKQA